MRHGCLTPKCISGRRHWRPNWVVWNPIHSSGPVNGPYREWFLMPTAMVAINSVIGLINSGTDVRSPWGTCRPRMASSRSNSKELDERPTHVEGMVGRFFAHRSESSSAARPCITSGCRRLVPWPSAERVSPCVGTCSTMADPPWNRVRSSSGPLLPSFDSDPSRCSRRDGAHDAIRALLDHVVSTHEEGHTVSDDVGRVRWLTSVAERGLRTWSVDGCDMDSFMG